MAGIAASITLSSVEHPSVDDAGAMSCGTVWHSVGVVGKEGEVRNIEIAGNTEGTFGRPNASDTFDHKVIFLP